MNSTHDSRNLINPCSRRVYLAASLLLALVFVSIILTPIQAIEFQTHTDSISLLLRYEETRQYIGTSFQSYWDVTTIQVATNSEQLPAALSNRMVFGLYVWLNTTGWNEGGSTTLPGDLRTYSIMPTSEEVDAGRFSCWQLNSSGTFIYYERTLGVLIAYRYQDIDWDQVPPSGVQSTIELTESNLYELIPANDLMLQVLLCIGIIGEVFAIMWIVQKRFLSENR